MKQKILPLIILALVLVCVCFGIYPSFMDSLSQVKQTTTIGSYTSGLEHADKAELEKARRAADMYNRKISESQDRNPFHYEGSSATDEDYESVLNFSGDGVMGYVEIPGIGVYIPVRHGTSSKILEEGAGHLYGTSVPAGGEDTHSVISAHTGLESAKLFTDLDKLRNGDVFCIHVLNETLYYMVEKIRVILPEDADEYLRIQKGRDLVTLYTCTPYGLNTHRLLVTAHRTTAKAYRKKTGQESASITTLNRKAVIRTALYAALPFAILGAGCVLIFKPRRK